MPGPGYYWIGEEEEKELLEVVRAGRLFRYGDRALFAARPQLDGAPIYIHFHARQRRYHRVERRGTPADYQL